MTMHGRVADGDPAHGLAHVAAPLAARTSALRGRPARHEPIRVVLVDDHTLIREGVRVLLQAAPDIAVVGEADDGAASSAGRSTRRW